MHIGCFLLFPSFADPPLPMVSPRPSTHKLRSVWGTDVVDLMEEMWAQDPKERPSMTTVVERLVEYHRIA